MAMQQHPRVPYTSWRRSRQCYTAYGQPKRRLTMAQARAARDALRREGHDMEMYVCEGCKSWHIGHRRTEA